MSQLLAVSMIRRNAAVAFSRPMPAPAQRYPEWSGGSSTKTSMLAVGLAGVVGRPSEAAEDRSAAHMLRCRDMFFPSL
jgi:hypothetical protein